MSPKSRRDFLRGAAIAAGGSATLAMFPPALQRALSIPASRRTGTLEDVAHVVILMQENRSFDHYFGTMRGVRGFSDRFPIPVPESPGIVHKTVWHQAHHRATVLPFPLQTDRSFAHMRVSGTPHSFPDAQHAWDDGRMSAWPVHKHPHALGHYTAADLPFQFAMAEAFTVCDAYFCAFHGGTNPNRVFLWTGTNDADQRGRGPVIDNAYDNLEHDPDGGYTFLTYCERLQTSGVSWQVYQNMDDNFTDNPLAGFRSFRAAHQGISGSHDVLRRRGLATRDLDLLRQDVLSGDLPAVSYIIATAEGSEHPGPSSPAQGADYTARVIDALTANPATWSKTVLLVMFDENDGFFDHVPPPCAPSRVDLGGGRFALHGDATVDLRGEHHAFAPAGEGPEGRVLLGRPYGPGPRVPLYVISPWSKGGWVNSEVFDHTSVIRFLERRFGVSEPNISPYRRAICGDLTSAFDFATPDDAPFAPSLPRTELLAARTRSLPGTTTPPLPDAFTLPAQPAGPRPSRALPYELEAHADADPARRRLTVRLVNTGRAGAVFHLYDRRRLEHAPRRYAVEAGTLLDAPYAAEEDGHYDLWLLGPNGFHRHFLGALDPDQHGCRPTLRVGYDAHFGSVHVRLRNEGRAACIFRITDNAYGAPEAQVIVAPRGEAFHSWRLEDSGHWYDFTAHVDELPSFLLRFAGRVETGRHGVSDPAMAGPAITAQAYRSPAPPPSLR